jgi:DNA-binding transcriptional MerR regulator
LQDAGSQNQIVPEQKSIPDKLYFKIGEVSEIAGVATHVLRYWESEFKAIRPQRASSRQRLYRRADIENILLIKKLLHEEGYTIPGARKYLEGAKKTPKATPPPSVVGATVQKAGASARDFCRELKAELEDIRKLLQPDE